MSVQTTEQSHGTGTLAKRAVAMTALGVSPPLLAFVVSFPVTILALAAGVDLSLLVEHPVGSQLYEAALTQVVAMGGLSAAYLRYRGWSLRDLGVALPDGRGLAVLVLAPVAFYLVNVATTVGAGLLGLESETHSSVETIGGSPTAAATFVALSLVVIGPFEELLYRGAIQTSLRERFDAAPAVGIAGVAFTIIHVPAYAMSGIGVGVVPPLVGTLLVGVGLGTIYEYRGNLVEVALVHGVHNALVAVLILVSPF